MSDCLVIIDVQKGFLSSATEDVPSNLKTLLSRRHFDHIVATQFINTPDSPYVSRMGWTGLMENTPSTQVDPFVAQVSERIFQKKIYSCFTDEFREFLAQNSIERLYFVGIDTDCCVLKSCTDAFESDIPFEVLLNYCASNGGSRSHEAAITVMKRTIGASQMNTAL